MTRSIAATDPQAGPASGYPPPVRCDADPTEEAGWVVAARGGDREALLRLLARCRPPLVRMLAAMTGDRASGEDLAQETLLHALPRLGQLRNPASFSAWLRRQGARRALRWLRKRRGDSCGTAAGDGRPTACPTAPDPARRAEARLAIDGALASLPSDLRVTLVLREMEQLDYVEIAALLSIPVGTVRSRLFAARERFRDAWEQMEEEE